MNLFEKYGGVDTVSQVVHAFYREINRRPSLQPYFEGVDMLRLIDHQVQFMSHVLGQPASTYSGRQLEAAHRALRISPEAFAEVAQILSDCLAHAGMEAQDLEQVMATLAAARHDVVAQA